MNSGFKRYWEPSTPQALFSSLTVGGVVSAIVYPIEFVKTRIQVRAEGVGIRGMNHHAGYNPFKIVREIHESGRGLKALYEGVDSYVAARLVHLFVRNLTYKIIYDQVKPAKPTNDLTTREKAVLAGFAGGLAAIVSNPLELINTRIQGDGAVYLPNRRNYANSAEAWGALQNEGQRAILKGSVANVFRAIALNVSQTGPYDMLREKLWITFGDADTFNHNLALLFSSGVSTLVTQPFDIVRTRLYLQFPEPAKNRFNYVNYRDCFLKIFQNEGVFSYYSGFYTYWFKNHVYAFLTISLM